MIFRSPAKLNLFLRVLRKRPDGYHDLSTLMQAVDLVDTIKLDFATRDAFYCTEPQLPMDANNLVVKAVHLFRSYIRTNRTISLYLDKQIPMQAGLGGGSSNAATTLWGLNKLFQTQLTHETLVHLASQLGSDVPFFFSSGRALCKGRGEILESLPHSNEQFTIYKFPEGASTAEIFRRCEPREVDTDEMHQNDLQPITESLLPAIADWKQKLPSQLCMTGSGSAYFTPGHQNLMGESWHVKTLERASDGWYWWKADQEPVLRI